MRVLLFIFSLLIFHYNGLCCRCTEKNSVEQEIAIRDLVVKGTVVSIDTLISVDTIKYREIKSKKDYLIYNGLQYIIKVKTLNAFKGANRSDTLSIVTGLGGGDCGFPFEVGKDYIIYANATTKTPLSPASLQQKKRAKGQLKKIDVFETHICTRTALVDDVEEQNVKAILTKNGS